LTESHSGKATRDTEIEKQSHKMRKCRKAECIGGWSALTMLANIILDYINVEQRGGEGFTPWQADTRYSLQAMVAP
jgi:hypothetical protein